MSMVSGQVLIVLCFGPKKLHYSSCFRNACICLVGVILGKTKGKAQISVDESRGQRTATKLG